MGAEQGTLFDRFLGRDRSRPAWSRIDWAVVFGGYGLLVLAFFLPLMTGGRMATAPASDMVGVWLWSREYLREALRTGSLPLWNPYSSAGIPYLASQQTAVFYPANWLFALVPTVGLMNAQIVFHFWAGLAAMHGLARHLGRSVAAAAIAALVFGFSGFAILHWSQGHLPFVLEWPWTPMVVLAWSAIQFRSQRGGWAGPGAVLPVLGLAVVLALQFLAGQPQMTYFTLLMLVGLQFGWILWTILGTRHELGEAETGERPYRAALRGTVWLGAGMVLSAPLVAVQALPMLEFLRVTVRGGAMPLHELQVHSLPLSQSLILVAPWAFGGGPDLPYVGSQLVPRTYHEIGTYVGMAAAVQALGGLLVGKGSGGGLRWTLGAGAFVSWWLALGEYGGLHETLLGVLPGLSTFRAPGRFGFLITFAVALLAAGGLDRLRDAASAESEEARRGFRRTVLLLGGLLAGGSVVVALLFLGGGESPLFRTMIWDRPGPPPATPEAKEYFARYFDQFARALGSAALIGVGALALISALAVPRLCKWVPVLLVALLGAELGRFALAYRESVDPRTLAWSPAVRRILTSGEGRWRFGSDRKYSDYLQGTAVGARHVWGSEPLILTRYTEAMQIAEREHGRFKYVPQIIPQNYSSPFTRALGMRWLLNTKVQQTDGPWQAVLQEGETLVLEDAGALPRGYTVAHARVVGAKEVTQAVNAADFQPTATVLLEEPLPSGREGMEPSQEGTAPGEVEIVTDDAEHFAARVQMARPGWFVLMDQHLPGWTASVDGEAAKIYRANAVGRALPLETGEHLVEMTYRAPGLAAGAWIAGISWLALLGVAAWAARGAFRRTSSV